MPTTTKMGIVYPASTDLVKDGATAMGTIATTVDSKSGLVLISTTSFSAVNSISLAANTFTSSFKNYRVIINLTSTSGATTSTLRLRASGTDNSSSNYAYVYHYTVTGATTYNSGNQNTTTSFRVGYSDGGTDTAIIDLFDPMNAVRTGYQVVFNGKEGANFNCERAGGQTTVTTAYDSLTYFQNTMTGTIQVYGYNN
jgi:hypothetical protein